MSKRSIISIIVMVALILGIISYNAFFSEIIPETVVTGGYRDGISLVPTDYDSTGISVDTSFEVSFEEGYEKTAEEVRESFTSDPAGLYDVLEEDGRLVIQPKSSLEEGTLYSFAIGETSWLYMTESEFSLIGTLPADQTTNVPVDTGIELYFTHTGADAASHFEIEPSVNGRFESYGNAVVFVPKKLEPETLYTVTLKAGLELKGSEETLSEDYTFSFETSYDESGSYKEPSGYFNYRRILNDFSTEESVYLPFNYNINKDQFEKNIVSSVYRLNDIGAAKEALETYTSYPSWSHYNNMPEGFDLKGLDRILEVEQTIEERWGYDDSFIAIEADLEPGFYIVASVWEDITFTTMFQVSDLSAYFFSDDDNQYFWIHNLATDTEAGDVSVTEMNSGVSGDSEGDGVVVIDAGDLDNDVMSYYHITSGDKETLMYNYPPYRYDSSSQDYWAYLQTDRNLYQPDDMVEFYGFLQHRDDGTAPSQVTVEISEQRWFFWDMWPGMGDVVPLVSEEISLKGGFYEGTLNLPNLSEGGYEIVVKDGLTTLARHYITVEKYVKPDYKMDVTKDKEAVFVGETVNFEMKTAFFEGTPVSDLAVRYNVYGMDWADGEKMTDVDGFARFSYTPKYMSGYQDEVYGGFNASAILPESGELYGSQNIRIFVNDINVDLMTDLDDETGTIEASVNTITLDRINDGSAEDRNDFLDKPVSGHPIEAVIYRNEWIKTETGETYDFINKVVRKTYDYHMETTVFEELILTTDGDGNASVSVTLPKEDSVYYNVKFATKDLKDRSMMYERYFSDYEWFYYYDNDRVTLQGADEAYPIGEAVTLEMVQGDKAVEGESFMYVIARTGIQNRLYSESAKVRFDFEKVLMPNAEVFGVAFNGNGYVVSDRLTLQGDYADQNITLEVSTDKDNYRPGETVTLDVTATYEDGSVMKPVTDAVVNLSLVDEALFALQDQNVDTLADLYRWVIGGIVSQKGSHNNSDHDGGILYGRGPDVMEMAFSDDSAMMDTAVTSKMAVKEEAAFEMNASDGGSVQVRSEFKDTALFATVQLDASGRGTVSFKLPDNVTSWRLTTSAISEGLQAGSEKVAVNVSLPFFINPTVNRTYLTGDIPYAGVAGYGNDLAEDEMITYELTCDEVDYTAAVQGKAFEKVDLPMWALEKGTYEVTITARTESGLSDGYVETIEVVDTYQEMVVSDIYDASAGLTLRTNDYGMTRITFADRSKGMYVPYLYGLAYTGGKRVDQTYLGYAASVMLEESFGVTGVGEVADLQPYMAENGGLRLLPYSEADLDVTVKMVPFIQNENQLLRIRAYLHKQMIGGTLAERAKSLYGLALAGEQVLLELNGLAGVQNLDYESQIYIALTYSVLGDKYMAKQIYDEIIAVDLEAFESMSRIKKGSTEEAYIYHTSQILPLAAELDLQEAEGMFRYVSSNYSKTYLTSTDRLRYIQIMMDKVTDKEPSVTYAYDGNSYEVDFAGWYGNTVTLPSAKLDSFAVESVTSDVTVIANYNGFGVIDKPMDSDVSVSRYYEDYETGERKWNFSQGDIVKVVIDWKVADDAIDDWYYVKDYAPSGLVPIKSPWHFSIEDDNYWYRDIDGQSVTFGAYKKVQNYRPHFYYARVVSPGTFTADAPIIQGSQVIDSYSLGETQSITID